MKIIAEHLGRIERAEIELRPLTVFIGENGTNKTWLAQGLFAILERLRLLRATPLSQEESIIKAIREQAASLVRRAEETQGEAWFELSRAEMIAQLPPELSFEFAETDWRNVLGHVPSSKSRLALCLTRDELADGVTTGLRLGLSKKPFQMKKELFIKGWPGPMQTTDYGDWMMGADGIVQSALEDLVFIWRQQIRMLPVEREHLAQVFPLMLSREAQGSQPRALHDFCKLMALAQATASQETEPGEHALRKAIHQIMGGRFGFIGVQRRLTFEFSEKGVTQLIPIEATASLQKSLAGLDIFLQSAGPGDILIIDEPELSTHPQAQVELVELFALMIRAGIQLVLVTHSPYILDHLSTLIEASRLDDEQRARAAESLWLKNPDAYLKPEELAVWQFGRDGQVKSQYDPATRSINWSTFTRVSNQESVAINRILDEVVDGDARRA